jgi:hypothetical protein
MAVRASGPHPDKPAVHPDIVVIVPLERLTEAEPNPLAPPAEILGQGPITTGDLIRLALLDAAVSTLSIDGHGWPLNLGRAQRLANRGQRIAVTIRDRTCVVPGCDRPGAWCQYHHIAWWDRHHGTTDLHNLCLVCHHHHHLIHDNHWTIHQDDTGTWHLTRPDGTNVPTPRYPGPARARPPT